uniref:Uncharacterized protein LOC102809823 n=1 Tax=Saccoglossus kowalevskii TaxID=10224 RepID=A0ABM0MZ44_SACKO|nr:PREDICTED: uncharacterized protein LOC102809823 [Saccoglossus kowalevskii]
MTTFGHEPYGDCMCFNKKSVSQLLEKELKIVDTTICKSITTDSVTQLRIKNKKREAVACLLKNIETNPDDAWAWSQLGTIFEDKGESSKATTALKQAARINGKLSSHVTTWHYIGPFVVGKPEIDGDPLEFYGGIYNASKYRYDKKVKYYSELVPGAEIQWKKVLQKSATDNVQINPQINWNDLVSGLGSMAITEWQGWAVGEFAVNHNNEDVLIQCLGVAVMYVDGIYVTGDVYRRNQYWFAVSLSHGIHTLYVNLRTKGTQVFQCNIKLAGSDVLQVHEPLMKPDLIDGHLFGHVIPIPVTNRYSDKWMKNIKVAMVAQDSGSPVEIKQIDKNRQFGIAPGQTVAIVIEILHKDELTIMPCTEIRFTLKLSTTDGHSQRMPVSLRCRNYGQSFIYTFIDHDGSVQQASAIPPLDDCPNNICPQGHHSFALFPPEGVQVQNQADSYKRMENGDWIFGFETAWVLAATRHGAHNWEGPGALTSITALDTLEKITFSASWLKTKASASHVIFAGHSMGGHGAWHLATHFPDRALAVMSLAGWIKKEEYSDSNEFFRHDTSTSHTDPAVKAIMEACIVENNADIHVSNIQHLDVFTRIGANDRTVHPYFVRRMYRLLKEQKASVTYDELAGKEHWWWDTWETNDGGAVNDKSLRDFIVKHTSNLLIKSPGMTNEQCDDEGCDDVAMGTRYTAAGKKKGTYTLTVVNPAFMEGLHGIQVIQQIVPFRISKIKIEFTEDVNSLTTTNVQRIALYEPQISAVGWNTTPLRIDNTDFSMNDMITAMKEKSHFCQNQGTKSSSEFTSTLQQLSVYIANLFFLTSDTIAPVIKDVDLTDEVAHQHNLIVLGGPNENSWTSKIIRDAEASSLVNEDKSITLGECQFTDPKTGVLFLAPHRGTGLALILAGNSLEGIKDIVKLASPTIPPMTRSPFSNMVPDFVITGPEFKAKGPGGYLCAGFWGNKWEFKRELSSCTC